MEQMFAAANDRVFVFELPEQHLRQALDEDGQRGVGARPRRGRVR